MSLNRYFSYIRVSTQRQGQTGTSLVEQQSAIERYAGGNGLKIVRGFEERQTAAKAGRPVFLEMLKLLKQKKAEGVIIHKIDRSARNLRDWADLGSLIDSGIEVHFAAEGVDLGSRGGRLSADIQAVVAADYIRNLREETMKGLCGRLRQGLYPFPAPIGYVNRGIGKAKTIHPIIGPLIRQAFELYSTGEWGLFDLCDEMYRRGLQSNARRKLNRNSLAHILHNPFYVGIIRIRTWGEDFHGVHEPIVSKRLFDQVQDVFSGKYIKKKTAHFFIYRGLITCQKCGHKLIGEVQKGHTYYRCHTRACLSKCVREERITAALNRELKQIHITDDQIIDFRKILEREREQSLTSVRMRRQALAAELEALQDRHSRLIDGYMDGVLDSEAYALKKADISSRERGIREDLIELSEANSSKEASLVELLELARSVPRTFEVSTDHDKRDVVKSIVACLLTDGEETLIQFKGPFASLGNSVKVFADTTAFFQERSSHTSELS